MKLTETRLIELLTKEDIVGKISKIRAKKVDVSKNHRRKLKFDSTNERLNYQIYTHLCYLKKGEVYIQIDNQPTFWECRDDTDGLLIHKNVLSVTSNGPELTVYCDNLTQKYRFCQELECFEKLLMQKDYYAEFTSEK